MVFIWIKHQWLNNSACLSVCLSVCLSLSVPVSAGQMICLFQKEITCDLIIVGCGLDLSPTDINLVMLFTIICEVDTAVDSGSAMQSGTELLVPLSSVEYHMWWIRAGQNTYMLTGICHSGSFHSILFQSSPDQVICVVDCDWHFYLCFTQPQPLIPVNWCMERAFGQVWDYSESLRLNWIAWNAWTKKMWGQRLYLGLNGQNLRPRFWVWDLIDWRAPPPPVRTVNARLC